MADEEVATGVDLLGDDDDTVDETPAGDPPAEPAEKPAAPAPPKPDEKPAEGDEDAAIEQEVETEIEVDQRGRKFVPLPTLIKERKAAKATKDALRELEPLAKFLNDNPDLVDAYERGGMRAVEHELHGGRRGAAPAPSPKETPKPAPTESDFTDEEIAEAAEIYGLYNGDGTPDTAAVTKMLSLVDKRAARQSDKRLKPYEDAAASSRAGQVKTFFRAKVEKAGANPALFDAIVADMEPTQIADPGIATTAYIMAIGLNALRGGGAPAPPPKKDDPAPGERRRSDEPIFTERAGGRRKPVDDELTDDDRDAARRIGRSISEFRAIRASIPEKRTGGISLVDEDEDE